MSSYHGKLDHKVSSANQPEIVESLDSDTLKLFGGIYANLFLANLPEKYRNTSFKIYHILEKHGQNETVWMSCGETQSIRNFSVGLSQRYGWSHVYSFSFAWTLEVLFIVCNDCRMQQAHECKSKNFSHFISESGLSFFS
jgi:hypothetical protein